LDVAVPTERMAKKGLGRGCAPPTEVTGYCL